VCVCVGVCVCVCVCVCERERETQDASPGVLMGPDHQPVTGPLAQFPHCSSPPARPLATARLLEHIVSEQ